MNGSFVGFQGVTAKLSRNFAVHRSSRFQGLGIVGVDDCVQFRVDLFASVDVQSKEVFTFELDNKQKTK